MKQYKHGIMALGLLVLGIFPATAASSEERANLSIHIGNLEWMSENLDISTFRNGDPIPEARTDEEWYKAGKNGKPAFCYYRNDPADGKNYGKLYNWYAVNDPRGLAPVGWHVASDTEWRATTHHLGGSDAAGTMMKNASGWLGNGNGTNSSEFSGLPAGCRDLEGSFSQLGEIAFWWTSSEWDESFAWYHCIDRSPSYVYRTNYYKANGLSVRCVRDPDY
jgi:uncharacterized protein (TIGR02145 family)